jgi:hypothetical protein
MAEWPHADVAAAPRRSMAPSSERRSAGSSASGWIRRLVDPPTVRRNAAMSVRSVGGMRWWLRVHPDVADASPSRRARRRIAMTASVVAISMSAACTTAAEQGAPNEPKPSMVDSTVQPVQSARTTTPDATVQSTSTTSTSVPLVGEYEVVAGQTMPGSTDPIPAPGEAYDGTYFAYLHEGARAVDPQHLRFDVVQAFSGADCAIHFGAEAPLLCTPIGTDLAGPVDRLELAVAEVPVSVRDLNGQAHYSISGRELVALVHGAAPSTSAPAGFAFCGGFGFLLTYDAGVLIRIDQPAPPETA